MPNTANKRIMSILLGLLFCLCTVVPVNAADRYLWLYSLAPGTGEGDMLRQLDFLEEQQLPCILLLDASGHYAKRNIYLLGQRQQKERFLIALTNTPKSESEFYKDELLQYFEANLICSRENNQLRFLTETGKTYECIHPEAELAGNYDQISEGRNYVCEIRSDLFDEGQILNLKGILEKQEWLAPDSLEAGTLTIYDHNGALRWFNNLGRFVVAFNIIVLVAFAIFLILFKFWSRERLRRMGGG